MQQPRNLLPFIFIRRHRDTAEQPVAVDNKGKVKDDAASMPKYVWKIVVFGATSVGKTSVVEQVIYGNYEIGKTLPTIEDIYDAWVETDKAQKERIRIYDTSGLDLDLPKVSSHHLQIADGFILIFSVCSKKSFKLVEDLKHEIERVRGKEFPMVVLGTKIENPDERECEHETVINWAKVEKVKLFEVLVASRKTLQEPFTYLVKKIASCTGKVSSQADVKKMFRRGTTKSKEPPSGD